MFANTHDKIKYWLLVSISVFVGSMIVQLTGFTERHVFNIQDAILRFLLTLIMVGVLIEAWIVFTNKKKPTMRFMDFHEAWWFLTEHPAFKDVHEIDHFQECLDIEVVKVNPNTDEVDDDESKNTATRVWLECGRVLSREEVVADLKGDPDGMIPADYAGATNFHDIDLDCGAPTFEEAIRELAGLVYDKYGDYEKSE